MNTLARPLKSPLRYPGGKSRVAPLLAHHFPPHTDYREIFAGGAALFFHKPLARRNWLNDLHPGLAALYLALRDHFDEFAALCRAQTGRRETLFNYWAFKRRDLMAERASSEFKVQSAKLQIRSSSNFEPATLNSELIERAVQYYFLNRTVWGGRVVFDPRRTSRLYFSNPRGWDNLEKKLDHLRRISQRLRKVKLTCQSYERCLARATPDTFIYADPPYYRESTGHITDKLYDKSFDTDEHRRLAELLRKTPAKVMVSYDDCPQVRELYPGWHFIPLQWTYCGRYAVTHEAKAAGRKEKKPTGRELLILNYQTIDDRP